MFRRFLLTLIGIGIVTAVAIADDVTASIRSVTGDAKSGYTVTYIVGVPNADNPKKMDYPADKAVKAKATATTPVEKAAGKGAAGGKKAGGKKAGGQPGTPEPVADGFGNEMFKTIPEGKGINAVLSVDGGNISKAVLKGGGGKKGGG